MSGGKDLFGSATTIASDVLSAFNLPGGNSLAKFAELYIARKRREATEILIRELRQGVDGEIDFGDDIDPMIEMVHRFARAVDDGAARLNLRLLAQIIAGMKRRKAVDPDAFRRWSGIIALCSRDELIVIGKAIALSKIEEPEPGEETFFKRLESSLLEAGYQQGEIDSLLTSVSRTGLLSPASGWGCLVYSPSPWLAELAVLADFETLAEAEQAEATRTRSAAV